MVQARGAQRHVGHLAQARVQHLQREDGRVEDHREVLPERGGHGSGSHVAVGVGAAVQGGHAEGPGRVHGHKLVRQGGGEHLGRTADDVSAVQRAQGYLTDAV